MEEQKGKKQGHKGKGQKYKSLLVWDILLKKTDENHALQLKDIKEHLAHYGITAERHSNLPSIFHATECYGNKT